VKEKEHTVKEESSFWSNPSLFPCRRVWCGLVAEICQLN